MNEIKAFSYTQKKYSSTALTIEGYEIILYSGLDLMVKYEYMINAKPPYYTSKYYGENERKEIINDHWSGYYISREINEYQLEWWEYK